MAGAGITATISQVTNFGPPEGNDTILADAITSPLYVVGEGTRSAIGTTETLHFSADSVSSGTNVVVDLIEVRGRRRGLSVSSGNTALTGTTTFDLYNATQSAVLIGPQTITTGGTSTTTTFTTPIIEDGDVIELRVSSGTSVTYLRVNLVCLTLAAPPGL